MRCLKCIKNVERFLDKKWKTGVNKQFFDENFKNENRLLEVKHEFDKFYLTFLYSFLIKLRDSHHIVVNANG